jgi:serine/threonine protein kinase
MTIVAGRYVLGDVLGTGAMAQVRQATDILLERQVAVKVFREDLDDDSAARARSEMKTLGVLSHPRLVGIHDAGTREDGHPYLVMELVDGPTLAQASAEGSLTPERLVTIGADLADALAYVHSQGVVHRDVKPANILLADDGAKLTDFGIARIVDGARHTGTGLTIGTAPYLAPEQVTGAAVGPATDVYALGLVLLECLTGHREYDGNAVEAAMARLHRPPRIPASLPAPWPDLLAGMTAMHPGDRPTAEQVAAILRGSLPATTVLRPVDPTQTTLLRTGIPPLVAPLVPPRRKKRRQPVVIACAAAGALLLMAFVVGGTGGSGSTPKTPTTSATQPTASPTPAAVAPVVATKVAAPAPAPAHAPGKKKHGKH